MVEQFRVKPINVTKSNSTVYNINYHIVFCPKYRRKILVDEVKKDLELIIKTICLNNDFKLIELEIMPDHVHLFISTHPKHSPMEIVKKLKGISARLIFKTHPSLKKKEFWGKHLWSGGYYIGTAGVVTSESIQKYIRANSSQH